MNRYKFFIIVSTVMMMIAGHSTAAEIRVAAASNFTGAIKAISNRFEAAAGYKVVLMFGSTGKHYAQIKNGAPVDLFFAADVKRPLLLEKEGLSIPGSRFTYAVGRLVLWSPEKGYVDSKGRILEQGDFRHLAIANPKLAPYGIAARQILQAGGLWQRLKSRMVRGENISQTCQFVKSGNAELGFVARSQVKRPGQAMKGSFWDVPRTLYTPIEQQAVMLKKGAAASAFLAFVRSETARNIIRGYGYHTP